MNDLSGIRALGALLLQSAVTHAKSQTHRLDRTREEIQASTQAIREAAMLKYELEREQRDREMRDRVAMRKLRVVDVLQDEYQADKDDERNQDFTR